VGIDLAKIVTMLFGYRPGKTQFHIEEHVEEVNLLRDLDENDGFLN
jgi:hypothetical protein